MIGTYRETKRPTRGEEDLNFTETYRVVNDIWIVYRLFI